MNQKVPKKNVIYLNTSREQIHCGVFHTHDIPFPPSPKSDVMGLEPSNWLKFHKVKGHHTKGCYQLKREIEFLIHEGHLKICQIWLKPNPKWVQLSRERCSWESHIQEIQGVKQKSEDIH